MVRVKWENEFLHIGCFNSSSTHGERGVGTRVMGGSCPHRSAKKRRYSHKSARRTKFMRKGDDLIYDELRSMEGERSLSLDEDLPGMGQFYCLQCDRHFSSSSVRGDHFRTKLHKKRVKQMKGLPPHTQLDAELAAGMGMPDNGLKLMST